MANDNQTALMMSIQQKKDKIKELEFEQRALRNFSEVPIMQNSVSDRIKLLEELVADDEKLLPVDFEKLNEAYYTGYNDRHTGKGLTDIYAEEKYGTDGK